MQSSCKPYYLQPFHLILVLRNTTKGSGQDQLNERLYSGVQGTVNETHTEQHARAETRIPVDNAMKVYTPMRDRLAPTTTCERCFPLRRPIRRFTCDPGLPLDVRL